MSSVNVKKSLLAFLLAILLVASMLPLFTYQASAAKYYSATGIVNDATTNTITILKGGKYRTFGKMDAKVLNTSNGISLGDTVKIIYNAANPQDAVQIVMVSPSQSSNRRPHETHVLKSATGVISNAGMSTITITTKTGDMSFDKEDAQEINMNDGILLGDKVRITYYNDNPNVAVQIIMVEHSSLHDDPQPDAYNQMIGEVLATGDGYFTCQSTNTGITYTFYYHPSYYDDFDIEEGDTLLIMIDPQNPSTALRVIEQ